MNLLPERLTATALQVGVLEHFALAVRSCVQHHQVQVYLVTAVPVLACHWSDVFSESSHGPIDSPRRV